MKKVKIIKKAIPLAETDKLFGAGAQGQMHNPRQCHCT